MFGFVGRAWPVTSAIHRQPRPNNAKSVDRSSLSSGGGGAPQKSARAIVPTRTTPLRRAAPTPGKRKAPVAGKKKIKRKVVVKKRR